MPTQSKDPRIEQVDNLLKAINQPYVRVEDVAQMIKQLVDFVRGAKDVLERGNKQSIAGFERSLSDFSKSFSVQLVKLEKKTEKDREASKEKMENYIKEVRRYLTDISEVDITSLERMIGEIEKKIPGPVSAIEVRDMLEALADGKKLEIEAIQDLRKELDELKKIRKVSGGGGILSLGHWPRHEAFTMNGSDTSVSLTQAVAAAGTALIVRYQGQTLDLTSQYTVDGSRVTLVGFTPELDTIISVTYWT